MKKFVWVCLLSVGTLLCHNLVTANDVTATQKSKRAIDELPPLRGNMAGVNLAFPRTQFGFPFIHYEGYSEYWGSGPKGIAGEITPTQDTAIHDFLIMVRMSNFKPVATLQDLHDFANRPMLYGDRNLPPDSHRWLEVTFSPALYVEGKGNLKSLFEQHLKKMEAQIGPFGQKDNAFGLKRIFSDHEGGASFGQTFQIVNDTFLYEDGKWGTVIECMRDSDSKSGRNISCTHYFPAAELKSIAIASFSSTADLSRWKEIETEIKKLVHSYVVHPKANN